MIFRHAKVSDCGKFLILMPIKDCINNAIYYADLTPEMNINGKIQLNPIIEKFEADYDVRGKFNIFSLPLFYIKQRF